MIVCVYRMGKDFSPEYVYKLRNAVQRHSQDQDFVCLTNDSNLDCDKAMLKHNWPGWWSKIELFRPDIGLRNAVYLDLDTVILANIDELINLANKVLFSPLRGFNQKFACPGKRNFASGVMIGDFCRFPEVYSTFVENPGEGMKKRGKWRHGDQGFIASIIGLDAPRIQDFLSDNYITGRRDSNQGKES